MVNHGKDVKIFACNSNHELAEKIAENLGTKLGDSNVGMFSDGEIAININEMVRGSDVFVIQSTSNPVNNNLMELLIMIDALKRASASRITAVMPYFGYARQDRKSKARDPISAKLVADLLTTAGADRILTMDLHAAQIQGFFNIPVDHLKGGRLLSEYYLEKFPVRDDVVVVSPDLGSVTRARDFAAKLDVPIAIIDKRRPKPNVSEVMNIIGDINGKKCILLDDMIDTAGTITNGAQALADRGAKAVFACCTHGVLSGPAIERINNSPIEELLTLDTIAIPDDRRCDKIKTISVASLFAEAIRRIYNDTSLSELF